MHYVIPLLGGAGVGEKNYRTPSLTNIILKFLESGIFANQNKLNMLFKKRNLFVLAVALLVIVTAPSCNLYPDSETRVEDLDITVTNYDKGNDFSQNKTYSIVDEVVEVDDDTTNPPDVITNSALIIQQIDANMQALGYDKIPDNTITVPDVRITAVATSTTTWFYYYYYYWDYWYWWGYYPCCYYYPPTYPVIESYTTGTLVMQMAQFKGVASGDSVKTVWTGVVNGLLDEDTPANLKTRIKRSIDEAFEQSPYLNVNGN